MVPGTMRRWSWQKVLLAVPLSVAPAALYAAGLIALGVTTSAQTSSALPGVDPGPFYPLAVGHLGQTYRDALPAGATYALTSGALPAGVTADANGAVRGSPTQTGVFEAVFDSREASGRRYPVRVQLVVRDLAETDLAAAATSFEGLGPQGSTVTDLRLDVRNTFDGSTVRTRVRLVRPNVAGPRPLLLFHRGRGFDHDSYQAFHAHLASWGIAVASVEDTYSFAGGSFGADMDEYDFDRAELGMQSASGVVEGVTDELIRRSNDPADPLARAFDANKLFFAGHSRGGGAVHASHQRAFELRMRGLIYLMAFDLRYFPECAPPGVAPAYPIFDAQPRTPSLVIAAENDGDLTYPIADQLIDRAAGPQTQVTLYGAVHNLISDSSPAEGDARISRAQERTRTADWMVAFIKRWSDNDARLDARLYGGASQGSRTAGVASWLPAVRTVVLEDAQDGDAARNRVGRNLVGSLRRTERSMYPDIGGGYGSLRLKHTILSPTAAQSVWRLQLDAPMDTTKHRRLVLRLAQTGDEGWNGYAVWVRAVDALGQLAWERLWEPGQGGLLPAYDGLSPLQRFVEVHAPLSALAPAAGAFDRTQLSAIDLVLVNRKASAAREVVVDAVRLE